MKFGEAIELEKQGKKVWRAGWNGKNQYVELATRISYVNASRETVNAGHDALQAFASRASFTSMPL